MATVNMPKIDTAETDIKVLVPQMLNAYAKLTKELSWLLNNLDTRNINYIDGDLLVDGTVTALKLIVDELSAISANLGKITSGEIYGAYIATQEDAYPRTEMSILEHLFAAFTDANNHIKIRTDISGSPGQRFTGGGTVLGSVTTYLGYLEIWVPSILRLTSPNLRINGWSSLYGIGDGKTLAEELDNIYTLLDSKADIDHTHSVTIPNHNHGNPDNLNSGGGTFTVS